MPRRLFLGLLLACALVRANADAQCGAKASSCSTCHDGTRAALPARAPWHDDHGFADLCASCHGGRAEVDDLAQAHDGLVAPLGSGAPCASCHGPQADALVERYRQIKTPASGAEMPPRVKTNPHGERGPNRAVVLLVVTVGALGAAFIVRRERNRKPYRSSDPSLQTRSS